MKPVALVTGGQQGIGLGIARALTAAGFDVAIAAELERSSPVVAAALEELGPSARYFQHDLSEVEASFPILDEIESEMGPISTGVNNAGIASPRRGDMLDLTPENFDQVTSVNLRGTFFLAQALAKRWMERAEVHYRSLLFITSVSAEMVSIERAEYCMSKAGATMMSSLFATRLAPHGIGVFELRPGIIATDMTAAVHEKYTLRIKDGLVPAARWGEPSDIGEIVVPLAQGQMRFASGASIPVDGGLSIPRL